MHNTQHGFALVEAVLAAVLLGVVAVTILGQFGDPLNGTAAIHRDVDAKTSSAAAINYTARVLDPVAFVSLEARNDCEIDDSDADFPSAFINPGLFAAGNGTTCR